MSQDEARGNSGGAVSVVVPYKNPFALAAYYCGVFSFICGIGLVLAPTALVLGIIGLKKRSARPEIHGAAHAWIGIVAGAIFTLVHYGLLVTMFIVPMLKR